MRTIYVGMDIHKNFIQAAAMDKKGNILREQKLSSNISGINRFVESLNTQKIKAAIESTCTWYHVYEALDSLGIDTALVNVRRIKVIAESKIKTDKLDAKSIAHCLRTGFIATAYIPPRDVMELRTILRHSMSLRKEITRHKNKIHAILLRNGMKHEYTDVFGVQGMRFLRNLKLRDSERYSLESHLNTVKSLLKENKKTTKKIEELCKNNEQAMLLTSIKGISHYSAMIVITEIGDITRFPNPKKLSNMPGLLHEPFNQETIFTMEGSLKSVTRT